MYIHSIVAIAAGEKIKHLLSSLSKFPYTPPQKKMHKNGQNNNAM